MPQADSLDKIVSIYLSKVCSDGFVYKGKFHKPKKLIVSPGIFRGYVCKPFCGGCCPKFTLDYLPSDSQPYDLETRKVEVNGEQFTVYSDFQKLNRTKKCKNLDLENGDCKIYQARPFSCDFELIRFVVHEDKTYLNQRLFGRGWAMTRIDGKKGALCEMTKPSTDAKDEVVRKLLRLKDWANYFKINTHIDLIVDWVKIGPHTEPLIIDA